MKPLVRVPLCASVFVTMTFTAPAAWAGATAVIEVLLTNVTPVAAVPPIFTVAPARKPVPVSVTAVPPAMFPELGVIEVTVGAGLEGKLMHGVWPSQSPMAKPDATMSQSRILDQ